MAIFEVDLRRAALAVTATAGGLFLFSVICIANTSPPSYPATEPLQQETAQIEQPGELNDTDTVIPASAVQPETPTLNEAQTNTAQPRANDLTGADSITQQPTVKQYWSPVYANNDSIVNNLTYPAIPPVTKGVPSDGQQDSSSNVTSGKTATKSSPVNQVQQKDGKLRRPFLYVDIQGLWNRFGNARNTRPPRLNREMDN